MARVPCYGDQWNIVLPPSASVHKLRACVYFEYARESQFFVETVSKHRAAPNSVTHDKDKGVTGITYLDALEMYSPPLAAMVAAMGRRASLSRQWSQIPANVRDKMVAAFIPPIQIAEDYLLEATHCWYGREEMPPPAALDYVSRTAPYVPGEEPRRLISFVVDVSLPAALLKKALVDLFDRDIAPIVGGSVGQSAAGKAPFITALIDLAVLRLVSTRGLANAQTVASVAGYRWLREATNEKGHFERVSRAKARFRQLFPELFSAEDPKYHPTMISAQHEAKFKNSRKRKRRVLLKKK
jgi:hypothetical protein